MSNNPYNTWVHFHVRAGLGSYQKGWVPGSDYSNVLREIKDLCAKVGWWSRRHVEHPAVFKDLHSLKPVTCPYIFDSLEKYISLIIPAFNEEHQLPGALDETINYLKKRVAKEKAFSYELQDRTGSCVPLYDCNSFPFLIGAKTNCKENGLKVKLCDSVAEGKPPTTLSPFVLVVEWRCMVEGAGTTLKTLNQFQIFICSFAGDQVSDSPYEVQISIPIEGYDPIQFTLTKFCESRQSKDGDTMRGWAMFGVISCTFIVLSSLTCCGGFLYKTRVEQQHGLDALPGMTILTACLDTLSGGGQGYSGAGEFSSGFANQASWERQSESSVRTTTIQSERKYGSL